MSIKVLLADDNITAQRLGMKILTDAGYEVIAVSNGAAAVKKIAADKPDLLILDVYMPGYTGLEVCDKVKQDPSTSAIPVLLTATNMEPYNQADGSRVGADGFMIKPFEASDLLAVVQKFESRVKSKAVEPAQTVKMAAAEEFSDASYEEWKSESAEETGAPPAKVDVPHEMASTPALGMDDYAAPAPVAAHEIPAFGVEPAHMAFEEPVAPAFAVESAPTISEPVAEAAPAAFDLSMLHEAPTAEIPALETATLEHAAEIAAPAEFEATSAPQVPDLQVAPAAELETTASAKPEIAIAQDPGLVTNADDIVQFTTSFGVQNAEEILVGVAMTDETPAVMEEAAPAEAAPAPGEEPAPYLRTQKIEVYHEAEPEGVAPVASEPAPALESEMQRAFAVSTSGAAVAPAMSSETDAAPAPVSASIPEELVAQFAAELEQAHQERGSVSEPAPVEEAPRVEPTEVAASQSDEAKIEAAVNRALDKYKEGLRAELIASIVRELKG